MIPREILKKIRQLELRTNRLVTVSGSARVPRAVFGVAPKTRSPKMILRKKASPASQGSGATPEPARGTRALPNTSFQPPTQFGSKDQWVFSSTLTCVLSPGRGFQPSTLSVSSAVRPTNPAAGFPQDAASVSPAPWGEGRDEGGRNCRNLTTERVKIISCCNIMPCNYRAKPWAGFADNRATFADDAANFADDRANRADDVADFADGAVSFAGDRAAFANTPSTFADCRDPFAETAAALEEHRYRNAAAGISCAKRVFKSRNQSNQFSTP